MSKEIKTYYAIKDGMGKGTPSDRLVTFVEKRRTQKPLFSGGGNLHFVKLVEKQDHEKIVKQLELELRKEKKRSELYKEKYQSEIGNYADRCNWSDSLKESFLKDADQEIEAEVAKVV